MRYQLALIDELEAELLSLQVGPGEARRAGRLLVRLLEIKNGLLVRRRQLLAEPD
ncbi:MAG: hypothetical protein AAF311_12310 [Pseudomonadota bacterium]